MIAQLMAELGLENRFPDSFSLLCYSWEHRVIILRVTFLGERKGGLAPAQRSSSGFERKGQSYPACTSMSCSTICQNVSGTGLLNGWRGKGNGESEVSVIGFCLFLCYLLLLLCFSLSTSGLWSSDGNNFLMPSEEDSLVFAQKLRGRREIVNGGEGSFIPLGTM